MSASANHHDDAEALPRRARWMLPSGALSGVWVESAVFTALAVLIGRVISPDDPLFVEAQFPWPWLAPILLALRYGVLPGALSSSLLLGGWYIFQVDPEIADVPKLYFLGGLITVMVCGEYSGIWRTRLRRIGEINAYLEDRVERATRRLYLLRLSHERLEQDMLSRPATLREAVGQLRERIAYGARSGPLPGAADLLEFLAQYCQLEVAALYAPDPAQPAGYRMETGTGAPPPLRADDPLLMYARERRQLAHVQVSELDKAHPTDHLVVAPIETGQGEHLGMLVVTRMPFFALRQDTLLMITVMLSAYADGTIAAREVEPLIRRLPGLPVPFAEEFAKLARLQRDFGIDSHIVALICFGHPDRLDIFTQLRRERRVPDVQWAIESLVECSFVITLMPLAGKAAVDGYLQRLEIQMREIHGGSFRDLGIQVQVIPLAQDDPIESVRRLLLGVRNPDA